MGDGMTGDLSGMRILAVDDNEDTRFVLGMLLGLQGAQVTTVGSAREALEAVENARFDAFICDISLPDGDGYELMREIRRRVGDGAPAVAMTGFSGTDADAEARAAGFQLRMTKPVEFDELAATLARLLGREGC